MKSNHVRTPRYWKRVSESKQFSITIAITFFTELEKKILKLIWKHKDLWNSLYRWSKVVLRCHNCWLQRTKKAIAESPLLWHRQPCRRKEQSSWPRTKPIQLQPPHSRLPETNTEENTLLTGGCWEKWLLTRLKPEPSDLHKNQLKIGQRPSWET